MPILYNFHIFLATFYMIYWTNLLTHCVVPIPVFCMFFVSQSIHMKRSPNAINFMENYFGIYVIFGSWNHHKRRPTQPTRHQGAPEAPSMPCWVVPSSNMGWGPSIGARKIIYGKKSCKSFSPIGVMDLQEFKKPWRARSRESETEENREGDPISEGLPPLRHHGGHGLEGEHSSHLGRRPRKRKREGALSPSLPVAPERRRG